MNIKILGPGCSHCVTLEKNVRAAIEELGIEAEVQKVSDYQEIMKYGIMRTPGLVVNSEVKVSGRVPNKDEVATIIKALL